MLDAFILLLGFYAYLLHPYSAPGTPLWLGLLNPSLIRVVLTIVVLIYVVLATRSHILSEKQYKIRLGLLILIGIYTIGLSTAQQIYLRTQGSAHEHVHDHPLQIEEGIKYLLAGKNPYTETYHTTPMVRWGNWPANPALHHFISLPSTLYISLPVYVSWHGAFGWFDQRIVHLVFFTAAIVACQLLFSSYSYRLVTTTILLFNPMFFPFLIYGLDDIVFLSLLLWTLVSLKKEKLVIAAIIFAFACTTKHTAWFIAPFILIYLYQKYRETMVLHIKKPVIAFSTVALISLAPFLIWNPTSFFEDVYSYPAGTLPTSYPITGFGISPLLVQLGFIESTQAYFSFSFLQLPILSVVGYILWRRQQRKNALSSLLIHFGILVWTFWIFSRFFNDSYTALVVTIIGLGICMYYDEQHISSPPQPVSV